MAAPQQNTNQISSHYKTSQSIYSDFFFLDESTKIVSTVFLPAVFIFKIIKTNR